MLVNNIIIRPLKILLDILFCSINKLAHNPLVTLAAVSVILNIILLPLYIRADELSAEEQREQENIDHYRKMINGSFKGDERLLILNFYYKIAGHHPLSFLRSLIPLLIQVPFFIAAYSFFSELNILKNTSFMGISSLGKPDALLMIGDNIRINILPVIMTVINIVSVFIYKASHLKGQKIQGLVLAVFFLILLYDSPAALVIYWTINNLFSLGRNIVSMISRKRQKDFKICVDKDGDKRYSDLSLFIAVEVFIAIFMGVFIPSELVATEPSAFALALGDNNPMDLIWVTLETCLGFQVWGAVLYYTGRRRFRNIFTKVLLAYAVMCCVNIFMFKYEGGKLTTVLNFISPPADISLSGMFYNVFMISVFIILVIALNQKAHRFVRSIVLIADISFALISAGHINDIINELRKDDEYRLYAADQERVIPLSREGKNVMVIMLDRAISRYVPFMFSENPELIEQFDGFTWYPDTASFGLVTNYAAPALFGGYDYTPTAINERKDERLVDKHNEALKLMPELFASAGFKVTAIDLPLGNYNLKNDMSIFDDIEGVNAFNFSTYLKNNAYAEDAYACAERNLFFYTLYRVAPRFMKNYIYDEGAYLNAEGQVKYIDPSMALEYQALSNLDSITRIEDSDDDTFLTMANYLTHQPMVLKLPEYELEASGTPMEEVPDAIWCGDLECSFNGTFSRIYCTGHYHVNMLAFKTLGKWFDHLREEGVYDNTRIILVADHGWELFQFQDMIMSYGDIRYDIETINPLFMIKDFNSTGVVTDYTFMTNADTPSKAMEGLISSPINPYTGNAIDMKPKESMIEICLGDITDTKKNNGNVFLPEDCAWFKLHDSIFDPGNYSLSIH